MNPGIFRQYDIRGTVGVDLDSKTAQLIGKAVGTTIRRMGGNFVAVGRDCRLSSDDLRKALLEGLLSTGTDVLDIGLSTTPLLYYAVFTKPVNGGIMITGSHNPPDMNGFKILTGHDTIHGEAIQKLLKLIQTEDFEIGAGVLKEEDVRSAYLENIVSSIRIRPGMRIGLDFGNGTGAITTLPVLKRLGCEVHCLFAEPDGNFPNHHPDPTVMNNLKDLRKLVIEQKLDLGIAYDGDADRLGVLDERGDVIFGDMLMVLYSRQILKENPGAAIIGEVKCSQRMYDDITAHGGRAIMWKTGHSLIKEKLKEENALLAGEMSGHVFFRDRYFGFDDACYATLRLLEIISNNTNTNASKTSDKLSERLSDIPVAISTPEIRIECPDNIKFGVVEKAVRHFSERYKTITVDGIRILFENGWGLIRVSNTQPVIVLRFEATSVANLENYRQEVADFLKKEGVSMPDTQETT